MRLARFRVTVLAHRRLAALRRRIRRRPPVVPPSGEDRLQLLIDHAPAAMAMFDAGMRYLAVSRRWLEDYGLGPRNLLGRSHYEIFPEIPAAWREVHRRAQAGEVLRAEEDRFVRQDGSVQWLRWEVRPWHGAGGAIGGIVIFTEDITQRVEAAEALRESEDRYRTLFRNFHTVILLVDPASGAIVDANPAAAAFYGWSEHALRGLRVDDLAGRDPAAQTALLQRARDGRQDRFRLQHRLADGGLRDVEILTGPIQLQSRPLLCAIVRDVTEATRLEAEILAMNASLEERVAKRTAELQSANAELESFGYAVSHDLRAPLRAMNGFSTALLEELGPRLQGEERGWLDQIVQGSTRMAGLIDGLLQLSRITRSELEREWVDVTALAGRIRAELAATEPARRVQWEFSPGLRAWADPRMLESALRNLLGNAWKYTSKRPAARIRLGGGGGRITVEDDGCGFDLAHAGKLFQPFQRLHRAEEFPGLGIGLATVQRIVHRHGGSLEVRASVDGGACFTIVLPGPG